jgi:hypothetical protein
MVGITIKLPEETMRQLKEEARSTGRSVSALIRERVAMSQRRDAGTVYEFSADLAGSLKGSRKSAGNDRRRFRRS